MGEIRKIEKTPGVGPVEDAAVAAELYRLIGRSGGADEGAVVSPGLGLQESGIGRRLGVADEAARDAVGGGEQIDGLEDGVGVWDENAEGGRGAAAADTA